MPINPAFVAVIRTSRERLYQIAQKAGVDATFLSKVLNGIVPARPDDLRLRRIAEAVGFPVDEIFTPPDPTGTDQLVYVLVGVDQGGRMLVTLPGSVNERDQRAIELFRQHFPTRGGGRD